jgi:hypothetical protein
MQISRTSKENLLLPGTGAVCPITDAERFKKKKGGHSLGTFCLGTCDGYIVDVELLKGSLDSKDHMSRFDGLDDDDICDQYGYVYGVRP